LDRLRRVDFDADRDFDAVDEARRLDPLGALAARRAFLFREVLALLVLLRFGDFGVRALRTRRREADFRGVLDPRRDEEHLAFLACCSSFPPSLGVRFLLGLIPINLLRLAIISDL